MCFRDALRAWRDTPVLLPAGYLAAVFGGMAGLIGIPCAGEALRCARLGRHR